MRRTHTPQSICENLPTEVSEILLRDLPEQPVLVTFTENSHDGGRYMCQGRTRSRLKQ